MSKTISNHTSVYKHPNFLAGVLALCGWFAMGSLAQAEPTLSLKIAQMAAQAAVEQCLKDGHKVSAAVVDRGGNIKALLRADGAGPHTPDSSRKKAYTAASMGRSTFELTELLVKVPRINALRDMNDNILILGGGLPIKKDNTVIGGIGVGGAPGDKLDEACAQAGLDAIQGSK